MIPAVKVRLRFIASKPPFPPIHSYSPKGSQRSCVCVGMKLTYEMDHESIRHQGRNRSDRSAKTEHLKLLRVFNSSYTLEQHAPALDFHAKALR